jgi:hypothetical protein
MRKKLELMALLFVTLGESFNKETYKELLQKSFIVGSGEASTSFFWDWVKKTELKLSSVEKVFNLFKLQVENLLAY